MLTARAALAEGRWEEAVTLAESALADRQDNADALDVLGEALWMLGERERGLQHRLRAYAAHRRAGNLHRAAWLAVYIAGEHRLSGQKAAANGWLGRARRLLSELPLAPEHGWLAIEEAKRAGTPEQAEHHAAAALECARASSSPDVEVCALSQLGLARASRGHIAEGMALLDEAMAAALGGEASEWLCLGDACCATLVACDQLDDLPRALEWCRVVVAWTERHNFLPIQSWCRSIYGGVLIRAGEWDHAERALRAALPERAGSSPTLGSPLVLARLADLRVRQGRFDEAEQLLSGCEEHPAALQAVVALRLRQGDIEIATALVERAVACARDHVERAALLPLLFRVELVQGAFERAAATMDEMRELSRRLARQDLLAHAELAAGALSRSRGDGAALAHLEVALDHLVELGLPLEEGRCRLEMARCLVDEGSPLASIQARAACRLFERLGARQDADDAAALLRALGHSGRTATRGQRDDLTVREREVLDLIVVGLTNPEIAERLVISRKTAEHHVGQVLAKLGVRSRAAAVAVALRDTAVGR